MLALITWEERQYKDFPIGWERMSTPELGIVRPIRSEGNRIETDRKSGYRAC